MSPSASAIQSICVPDSLGRRTSAQTLALPHLHPTHQFSPLLQVRISLDTQLHMVREHGAPAVPGDWCRQGAGTRSITVGPWAEADLEASRARMHEWPVLLKCLPTDTRDALHRAPSTRRDMAAPLPAHDAVYFPYAVVEIKLQEAPPDWVAGLLGTGKHSFGVGWGVWVQGGCGEVIAHCVTCLHRVHGRNGSLVGAGAFRPQPLEHGSHSAPGNLLPMHGGSTHQSSRRARHLPRRHAAAGAQVLQVLAWRCAALPASLPQRALLVPAGRVRQPGGLVLTVPCQADLLP